MDHHQRRCAAGFACKALRAECPTAWHSKRAGPLKTSKPCDYRSCPQARRPSPETDLIGEAPSDCTVHPGGTYRGGDTGTHPSNARAPQW
eukprot:6392887-Alexandrium_andersonii.AAC.1